MVAIDLSLRSTGLVALDNEWNYKDCLLVSATLKDESLLEFNSQKICDFINKNQEVLNIAIEGLSFMSVSGSKDVLYGNFWHLRCKIYENTYYQNKFDIVPVTRWRSGIFKVETQRRWKLECKKNPLKEMVVNNLPEDVKIKLMDYIKENKFKVPQIYDLADAYWLARYTYYQLNNIQYEKI